MSNADINTFFSDQSFIIRSTNGNVVIDNVFISKIDVSHMDHPDLVRVSLTAPIGENQGFHLPTNNSFGSNEFFIEGKNNKIHIPLYITDFHIDVKNIDILENSFSGLRTSPTIMIPLSSKISISAFFYQKDVTCEKEEIVNIPIFSRSEILDI